MSWSDRYLESARVCEIRALAADGKTKQFFESARDVYEDLAVEHDAFLMSSPHVGTETKAQAFARHEHRRDG